MRGTFRNLIGIELDRLVLLAGGAAILRQGCLLFQDPLCLLVDLLDALVLGLIEGLGVAEGQENQHVKHTIFNDLGGKRTIW